MSKECPRCHKARYNSFTISRYKEVMVVNKCIICGYLWIFDEDLKGLAKAESKKMFIETLREIGNTVGGKGRKNSS